MRWQETKKNLQNHKRVTENNPKKLQNPSSLAFSDHIMCYSLMLSHQGLNQLLNNCSLCQYQPRVLLKHKPFLQPTFWQELQSHFQDCFLSNCHKSVLTALAPATSTVCAPHQHGLLLTLHSVFVTAHLTGNRAHILYILYIIYI